MFKICFFTTLASLSGDSLFSRESFNSQKNIPILQLLEVFSAIRPYFKTPDTCWKSIFPTHKNVIPKSSKLGHWLSEPLCNFRVCCFLFAILSNSGKYEKQCTSFELVKMVSTLPATCPKRKCTIWTKPFSGAMALLVSGRVVFFKAKTRLCWFLMRLHWPCLFLEPSMSWHAAYAQPSLAWPCKSDNTWKYSTQAWPTVLCIFADWHWKSPWLKTNVLRSLQKSIQCALRHRSQRLNCSRLLNDNVWSLLDNSLLQSFQAVILDSHIFSIGFATPFELQTDTHIDHLCTPCIVAHQILLLHSQIRPQTKFSSPLQSLHWRGRFRSFCWTRSQTPRCRWPACSQFW